VYDTSTSLRRVFAYQAKEGKEILSGSAVSAVDESFFLQGEADSKDQTMRSLVTVDALTRFFGVGGTYWMPVNWNKDKICTSIYYPHKKVEGLTNLVRHIEPKHIDDVKA
jgi:hypothetical protein